MLERHHDDRRVRHVERIPFAIEKVFQSQKPKRRTNLLNAGCERLPKHAVVVHSGVGRRAKSMVDRNAACVDRDPMLKSQCLRSFAQKQHENN